MLQRQARPKRKELPITITCKGVGNKLYGIYHGIVCSRFGKALYDSIPVLSIFVLLGIMGYGTIVIGFGEVDDEAYAAETVSNNTSLIIDNGTPTDSTATVRNGVAYSSHTVQVKADSITGYTLSITGPTNLSNGSTTINGAGGKTGSTMNDNTWGYGWNTTSTTDANMTYNSFTGNAQTLSGDSVSNNSINFTRKLVFAAKFNQNAAAGHYKANVKLNLVITPKVVTTYNYSVTYYANGGTGTVPAKQTASSSDSPYTLIAVNQGTLVRANYRFLGWSENSNATSATYTAGSAIPLSSSAPSKNLYAVWGPFDGITTMQEMTADLCKRAVTGAESTLIDSGRGDTSYTIRKLADGNCWMVDNLKLDLISYTLTSSNSDVSTEYTAGTATNANSTWSDTNTKAQFSTNGKGSSSYNSNYGYYYSWCAATAGTCSSAKVDGAVAPSSICPKGWKLPKGGSSGDFQTLYKKNAKSVWKTENGVQGQWIGAETAAGGGAFFPAAGYVYASGLDSAGSKGYYWARTAISSTRAYNLTFSSGAVSPADGDYNRYLGRPIRCVAYSS